MTSDEILEFQSENARLKRMILALADRVAAQSELLSRRAECEKVANSPATSSENKSLISE